MTLPGDRCCRTRSTGASRTSPTSRRPPPTCRSAGPTRASSSRPRWARWPTPAGSAPASPTTRGSSPPTASTRRSPLSPSASSGPPKTIFGPCATSRTSSTTGPASWSTRPSPTGRSTSATTRRPRTPTARRPTTSTPTRRSSSRARWRWSGAGRATTASAIDMYDFARRNLRAVDQRLDVDRDGWPEGSGNVERTGMGPEKLDNGVYYIRGLYDLADMARSKHDGPTFAWATKLARRLQRQFEGTWWDPAAQQYADSLIDPGNVQSFQKHWIGQVPMEAELTRGDQVSPGVASFTHGNHRARRAREPVLQRRPPGQPRPLPHGLRRRRRTARATSRSSRSRPRSRPSARATTVAWAPTSSSATPTPTPRRCSPSRRPATRPTSSPARCPRSSPRRPTAIRPRASRRTSTAAGPAARCSCRRGATTAPRGRWSTSSSACARHVGQRLPRRRAAGAGRAAARRRLGDPARPLGRAGRRGEPHRQQLSHPRKVAPRCRLAIGHTRRGARRSRRPLDCRRVTADAHDQPRARGDGRHEAGQAPNAGGDGGVAVRRLGAPAAPLELAAEQDRDAREGGPNANQRPGRR